MNVLEADFFENGFKALTSHIGISWTDATEKGYVTHIQNVEIFLARKIFYLSWIRTELYLDFTTFSI